ncbi:hypothetical protein ACTFIU_004873 [Dictyostelium citrinum]
MKLFLLLIILAITFVANANEQHWGSCRGFGCPEGNHCEVVGGYPVCVRDSFPSRPSCKGHHCPPGYECTMDYGEPHCIKSSNSQCELTVCPSGYNCEKFNSTVISCISEDNSCSTVLCPTGTYCFSRFGNPKCYTADEFPQLCRFTKCPVNYYCEMNGQNIDCIQGGIVPPTNTPKHCPTCDDLPCSAGGLVCVTVPNNNCKSKFCCPTRPMCMPNPTTSSTTSETTL